MKTEAAGKLVKPLMVSEISSNRKNDRISVFGYLWRVLTAATAAYYVVHGTANVAKFVQDLAD